MSESRACRTVGVSRASCRYTSTKKEPGALVEKLRELERIRPYAADRSDHLRFIVE